ncbi:MAG: rRNA adenine N(6)-methyltransferase family protein [Pseudonocardia sp.]|nr:rRNA adenine N(6)-methyltransferase family protein [Pseudonocardia sp.]
MPAAPHSPFGGRHELGQNFLVDARVTRRIAALVPPGPVLELGSGDGALTRRLACRPGRVTAVELDPARAARLRRTLGPRVRVEHADMLRYRVAAEHHVVSNVPFAITTPLLRHLLGQRTWPTAVLLLQWEVARKRAAVGRTTLLTASWWPWFEFALAGRVPSAAFRPRPAVDGGILVLRRRAEPLVVDAEREPYQRLVRTVFGADRVARWARGTGVDPSARPRDLTAEQWVALHGSAFPAG